MILYDRYLYLQNLYDIQYWFIFVIQNHNHYQSLPQYTHIGPTCLAEATESNVSHVRGRSFHVQWGGGSCGWGSQAGGARICTDMWKAIEKPARWDVRCSMSIDFPMVSYSLMNCLKNNSDHFLQVQGTRTHKKACAPETTCKVFDVLDQHIRSTGRRIWICYLLLEVPSLVSSWIMWCPCGSRSHCVYSPFGIAQWCSLFDFECWQKVYWLFGMVMNGSNLQSLPNFMAMIF